jgi:hypothetical protein
LAKVIVGMTISLDGFVADQNGNAGRLYPDLAALRHTAYMKDAVEQTGAVLMGTRTFAMGEPDSYLGNYEFQVPIFVLTPSPAERCTETRRAPELHVRNRRGGISSRPSKSCRPR